MERTHIHTATHTHTQPRIERTCIDMDVHKLRKAMDVLHRQAINCKSDYRTKLDGIFEIVTNPLESHDATAELCLGYWKFIEDLESSKSRQEHH